MMSFTALRERVSGPLLSVRLQALQHFTARTLLGLTMAIALLPGRALAQRPLGIDVSSYQGSGVDWASVKSSGRVFAWAKASEGVSINDADFTINEGNGKAAGVYMGAYHYAHPELNSAASEASHFWSIAGTYIKADGLTLIPMLDIEGSAFSGHVGATSLSDWINQWCTEIVQSAANAGVSIKPVIYISACNACNLDSSVNEWGSDIANYGASDGTADPQGGTPWSACSGCAVWGAGVWNFWQYASAPPDGSVPGVSGNCDVDVFNGTLAQLQNNWLAIANTNSSIFYWDPQGTTGGNPYTGSMSQAWENAKWSYTSAGLGSPVNWIEGKAACFGVNTGNGTPAYTVTMNSGHVVAGFFDGGLSPKACDITIQGSGIIQLATGPQALDSRNGSDGSSALLRINVPINGDGQLVPEGTGQSFLDATNAYTGGTQLGYPGIPFSGIVNFNNGFAFGTGPITLTTNGTGGALSIVGSSPITVTNPVTVQNSTTNNLVGNAAGLTFSGTWTLGGSLLDLGTGSSTSSQIIIAGVMSGTAGLKTYNSGTLTLTAVNTYSGPTTIYSPAVFTIGGAGQLGSGSYAGNLANDGTFNYNSTAAQALSGTISGAGAVKVGGAGTLTLTHANTFTNTVTVGGGGTLCVTADSALGYTGNNLTLSNGCLKNNNSSPVIASTRTINLGSGGGYLDAGWAPSHPLTIAAKLTGSGKLLIDMDGSPVVLNNAANNYTGDTIIGTNGPGYYSVGTQAWLKLGASGVIPNGSGFGNVIIYQAWLGLLELNGFSQTINGLSGDGVVSNSAAAAATLTVGNNDASSVFSGALQNAGGALSVTKIGAGTLTLNGGNTYTGPTAISAGVLALGSTGSIGNTPYVLIAAGATFDVSAISSFIFSSNSALSASGTASPATVKGGGIVNLGSQPIALAYDGSHPALTVSQGTLSLNGNAFSVNGGVLPLGTYTIIQQVSGSVAGSGPFPVTGTAIGAGKTGSITLTGGNVNLVISEPSSFSNLTPSQSITYGAATIALSGRVSGAGPVYPANGETVTVTINGNAQTTTINDATGDFSINYNPSTIPASGAPYAITYSYAGDQSLNPSSDSTTTLTINPAQTNIVLSILSNGNGSYTLSLAGAPNTAYYILSTSDITQPLSAWTAVPNSTNTSTSNGSWSFVVSNSAPAFYRAATSP